MGHTPHSSTPVMGQRDTNGKAGFSHVCWIHLTFGMRSDMLRETPLGPASLVVPNTIDGRVPQLIVDCDMILSLLRSFHPQTLLRIGLPGLLKAIRQAWMITSDHKRF